MVALPHRIRRLRWHVSAATRDEAFPIRTRLRRMHEADLLEAFARAFDAVETGESVLRVPRLEITVRISSLDELQRALASRLQEAVAGWRRPDAPVAPRGWPAGHPAALRDRPADHTPPASRAPAVADMSAALLHYLDTGTLPWTVRNLGRERTLALLVAAAVEERERILRAAPSAIERAATFFRRWLQLLPPAEWVEVARSAESRASSAAASRVSEAVAAVAPFVARRVPTAERQRVAAVLLAVALRHPDVAVVRELAASVLDRGTTPMTDVPGDSVVARRPATADRATDGPQAVRRAGDRETPGPTVPRESQPIARIAREEREGDEARTFGVAVDYAGLVLLHPFLPRLFEQTRVLEHGAVAIPETALPRAAALLSYAARGMDDPFEFECGFIKVLLGLALDAELPVAADSLSPDDRIEVDDLLTSIVEHWRVLKHTSIAGLRSAFLQRSGLLSAPDDGAWHLRVEPSAFDVLLDHLPWGINTVKLPWMTRPLFTEWMTS